MDTHNMNTTKLKTEVAILAILSVALLPGIVTAHDGEQHVIGIVAKVSDTSITLKTTAGKLVEVGFDASPMRGRSSRSKRPISKLATRS
jgi:hypothetical protein